MSQKITAHRAPGTRDFLPEEMALRNHIRSEIESSFRLFGFQPLETPALERLDVLTGKYGEEADRLIFKILKRGDELEASKASGELADLGLRYDLTVPLARVVAMNRGALQFPFKRYQIQPVWRAERQQKGRYREFFQCDADIVGVSSASADAEIIALSDHILQRLRIPRYRIHVNHRLMLQAIAAAAKIPGERFLEMCAVIDKMDKIGMDGVLLELQNKRFERGSIERLMGMLHLSGDPDEILERVAQDVNRMPEGATAVNELRRLFDDVQAMGVPLERLSCTLHLARGLDYYTGPIFETLIEEPRIGSITGGGRYDRLIGVFCGEDIPATGTSIGIERIFDVVRELNLADAVTEVSPRVLVAVFSEETRGEAMKITAEIRRAGISAEVFFESGKKLGRQFAYADKKRIPIVIVAGPDEIRSGSVTIKNLKTSRQQTIARADLIMTLSQEI